MESIQSEAPRKRGRPPKQKTEIQISDALEVNMDKKPAVIALTATMASGNLGRDPSKTIPEQLAGNSVILFNWKWPGAERDFPIEPWLRTVKHCFPYAKGGMILADHPQIEGEFKACERKTKALKAKGFRYVAITPEMTLFEAAEILGKGTEK